MSVLDANPHPHAPIHRGQYLGLMVGAICLGVASAIGVGMLSEGAAATGQWAAIALAVASLPTLLPSLLRVHASNWGTLVFASSAARMLLVIAVGFAVSTGQPVDRKPFWFGLLAGAIVVLLIESLVASLAIARRERGRSHNHAPSASVTPTSQPRTTS